jgi:hypothetical protein
MEQRIVQQILKQAPTLNTDHAAALAQIWADVVKRTLDRIMALSRERHGVAMHEDHQAEAVDTFASLNLYLADMVVKHRAKAKPLTAYSLEAETLSCASTDEADRIETTARNLEAGVWAPKVERWRTHRPLVDRPGVEPTRLLKRPKVHHRAEMHYVPTSLSRAWADPRSGKFNAYRRGLDRDVQIQPLPPRDWAVEPFLYTQAIEHHLGLVEGDAAAPKRKLIEVRALSEADRTHWIAFVIIQMMRTPRFLSRLRSSVDGWIAATGFPYGSDPASLGRAAETVFTNNAVYARWHPILSRRQWSVVKAAEGSSFLLGDNPVVIRGREAGTGWRLHLPLTPDKCFVVGPALVGPDHNPMVPSQRQLTAAETAGLNAATCAHADQTVIGVKAADVSIPKPLLLRHLPAAVSTTRATDRPYWGLAKATDRHSKRR